MGLDIYSGPYTRYYTKNWKTKTQQWAEEHGMAYEVFSENSDEENLSADQVEQIIVSWRDNLVNSLNQISEDVIYDPWPEHNEGDYFTDKPDWDAFGALLVFAGCLKYDLDVPNNVHKRFDFEEFPVIAQMQNDDGIEWSIAKGCFHYVPFQDAFMFRGQLPNGDVSLMGTTGMLAMDLYEINKLKWWANEEEIINWSTTEGYPTDTTFADGKVVSLGENTEYDTESLAKYAYSILYQAVKFSLEHKTPIIFDY